MASSKPSLSICAFGAGLAHAAALAVILPMIITLPAPADPAPQLIAIHVEIQTALAGTVGEGDAEDDTPSPPMLGSRDITAALPAQAETEALPSSDDITAALPSPSEEPDDVMEPPAPESVPALQSEPDAELPPAAVANVDAEDTPTAIPLPPRRPSVRATVERPEPPAPPKVTPKPVPRQHITASKPRSRTSSRPANKPLLGGRTATPMPEYPF